MSKSRRKQKIVIAWVLGLFSLLGIVYIFLDVIFESALEEVAEVNGIEIISLDLDHLHTDSILAEKVSLDWKVKDLLDIGVKAKKISKPQWWNYFMPNDLFRATIEEFEIVTEVGQVGIRQAQFVYFWKKLKLFLNAVSIDDLSIRIDEGKLDELLEEISAVEKEDEASRPPGFSPLKYLQNPPLSHVKFRDSNIRFLGQHDILSLDFNSTSLLSEGFTNLHLDGVLQGLPIKSDLTFTLEEDIIHLTSKFEFLDLASADVALKQLNGSDPSSTAKLKVNSGNLTFRKNAMIDDFASYRREQLEDGRFAFFRSMARFEDAHHIRLEDGTLLKADQFIIATGSRITPSPIPALDEVGYLTSDTALTMDALPKSIAVLGGGAIACEFAQFFSRFGVKVHLIQRSARILKEFDEDRKE